MTDKKNFSKYPSSSVASDDENDMQYKLVFHFSSNENEEDFKLIAKDQNISFISTKEEVFTMSAFKNRNTKLNFELENVLIAIITGGSLTAIIRSLRDVIIEYMKKSQGGLIIEKGTTKIKIEYNDKKSLEGIVNEEVIEKLFIPENESENE